MDPYEFLPASLEPRETQPLRGAVEIVEPGNRISGWALDISNPDQAVSVELLVGGDIVAVVPTTLPRPDIVAAGVACSTPGFIFASEILSKAAEAQHVAAGSQFRVRIAGTSFLLRPISPQPAFHGVALVEHAASNGPGAAPERAQPRVGRRLLRDLDQLMAEGAHLEVKERLAQPAEAVGSIEGVAEAPNGLFWVAGWMRRNSPLRFSGILAGPEHRGAGVALATCRRDDLPTGVRGIFGVIRTDAPLADADGAGALLRFGASLEYALPVAPGLAVWSGDEILSRYSALRGRLEGPDVRDLNLLLLRTYAAARESEVMGEAQLPFLSSGNITMDVFASSADIESLYARRGAASIPPPPDFNEAAYLAENADVAAAVKDGKLSSGFEHYMRWGRAEGRRRPVLLK
jgi:hypothetical protein